MWSDDTGATFEPQKHGSFIGLTQIGLFRWNGFLIHSLSFVSYPVRACRDGVRGWGLNESPVKADIYSKGQQAATPSGTEPFPSMCRDQRSPANAERTISQIAWKHGTMPSLPFGPLHPWSSPQPFPPAGVALVPSGPMHPQQGCKATAASCSPPHQVPYNPGSIYSASWLFLLYNWNT